MDSWELTEKGGENAAGNFAAWEKNHQIYGDSNPFSSISDSGLAAKICQI